MADGAVQGASVLYELCEYGGVMGYGVKGKVIDVEWGIRI